jgi:hypothetical protein
VEKEKRNVEERWSGGVRSQGVKSDGVVVVWWWSGEE